MAYSLPPFLTLEHACSVLLEGRLLVFPTETFHALGCDAMNPDAVGAVFSVKKRPLDMPLPLVISSREMLSTLVTRVSEQEEKLMDVFWPGPLSLVLPAAPEVPDLVTSNARRVAVRVSSHPAVRALCDKIGRALAASSANISGMPPAARLEDMSPELWRGVAGIFPDAAPSAGGLPSTVAELRRERERIEVRILRRGAVSREDLRRAGFIVQDCGQRPGVT